MGVTTTDVGVFSAADCSAVDGTLILAGSVSIGGAYGDTGVTITNDGIISLNGDVSENGDSAGVPCNPLR